MFGKHFFFLCLYQINEYIRQVMLIDIIQHCYIYLGLNPIKESWTCTIEKLIIIFEVIQFVDSHLFISNFLQNWQTNPSHSESIWFRVFPIFFFVRLSIFQRFVSSWNFSFTIYICYSETINKKTYLIKLNMKKN